MGINISLDYEVQHPKTLVVFEEREEALEYLQKLALESRLIVKQRFMVAKVSINGRRFRVRVDYKREGTRRWVHQYAGLELSRIELRTWLYPEDLHYLMTRLRGMPLVES